MSKILFGANDGNSAFTAHDTLRAKLSDDAAGAEDDLNNKIDYLLQGVDSKDRLRGEMLRACPVVVVMDRNDNVVGTFDNPIFETAGLDITDLDTSPVERQKSDKPVKQTSTKKSSEKSSKSKQSKSSSTNKSKKDQARDIFKRMSKSRRKDVIEAMCNELGFSKAHASTYYQAIKKEQ